MSSDADLYPHVTADDNGYAAGATNNQTSSYYADLNTSSSAAGRGEYDDGQEGGGYGDEEDDGLDIEDFDTLVRTVKAQKRRDNPPQTRAELRKLPEVADDYVRNYLVSRSLLRTLDSFETEWYEIYGSTGDHSAAAVPEVYVELAQAQDETQLLQGELERLAVQNKKLMRLFEDSKRERDFHRANHGRIVQEKDKLLKDVKGLQSHATSIDPTITELRAKYDSAQKDKMLLKLERDKLLARVGTLEDKVRDLEGAGGGGAAGNGGVGVGGKKPQQPPAAAASTARGRAAAAAGILSASASGRGNNNTIAAANASASSSTAANPNAGFAWPADNRNSNPASIPTAKAPTNAFGWTCRSSFKAHSLAATHLAFHPRSNRPLVGSCSDDGTWRVSDLPQGNLVFSGQGHRDWIAGIAMHPKATMMATASGDKTVKVWDFAANECKHTLKGHTEGVWCVEFHDTGDMLASGGLDHSIRIWDTEMGRLRQSLRGHVDAVNSIGWLWGTNTLVSGSGDKTVSLWDARANYCVQTFYGHHSAVSGVAVPPSSDIIASCDTEGQVIVWDVRMLEPRTTFNCGPHPMNSVAFDKSGSVIAAASDDHTIRMLSVADGKQTPLRAHDDAVQHAVFDPQTNGFLVSCGSDGTVKYWS